MTKRLPCRWAHRSFLGFLLLILGTLCASAAGTRRVVILNPYERDVAPFNAAVAAFKSTLARQLGQPVDIYEIPLNLARMSEAGGEEALVAYLAGIIKGHPVDLVVSVGAAGMQFAAGNREVLFPETPYLVMAGDPRFAPPGFLESNTTLITQSIDLQGIIEDILQLKPETEHIAVVFGSSVLERTWVDICRRAFEPYADRLDFTWLNDLTLDEVLEQCAVLPPDSFILHGLFVVDAAGVPCEHSEVLRRLHDVANAPVFAYFQSEFGLGSIGGRLYRDEDVGAEGARTAVRILRGEDPGSIPPQMLEATDPTFDWRELQRWGVSEASLPSGSVVAYRELGFWTHYRWLIIGVAGFLVLQAALIAGLLVNRTRRLREEKEAAMIAEISSKFINLQSDEVDREITDALGRLSKMLDLDLVAIWQWTGEAAGAFILTHLYGPEEGLQPGMRLSEDDYPWCRDEMLANRTVSISSLKELPAEADLDRENSAKLGIKSNVTIPLTVGGSTPIGILALNTIRAERDWPTTLVNRLQLVAQIFTNAIARKRADEALSASEARLAAGADLAGLGYYEVDMGDQTSFADERFHAICGVPPGSHQGLDSLRFWKGHLHPDDRQGVLDERQKLHDGGIDLLSIEYRYQHPVDGQKWIQHTARCSTRDPTGHATRTVGVVRDVTPQKQAEMEAEELRGSLTHLTRVSTVGALSGSLAHELNQPLGIILSNAQAAQEMLLMDSPDLEELQAILDDIVAADRRAGEVILRLRAMLKRGHVALSPLAFNQVIEEVLHLSRADLIGRGVTATMDLDPDLPLIAGDRVQLQQVLLNLILNAAESLADKASGQRRIHLETRLCEDRVQVSVRDEGCGLPEEVEALFAPFFTTKSQGLGMGLAICRTIVTAHHGLIWAESNPDGGAVFQIELPVVESLEKT